MPTPHFEKVSENFIPSVWGTEVGIRFGVIGFSELQTTSNCPPSYLDAGVPPNHISLSHSCIVENDIFDGATDNFNTAQIAGPEARLLG